MLNLLSCQAEMKDVKIRRVSAIRSSPGFQGGGFTTPEGTL